MNDAIAKVSILEIPCKICGKHVKLDFTPNSLIDEGFIRAMLVCNSCYERAHPKRKQLPLPEPKQASGSLPYRDE